jgi:hypothetical protein
MDKVMQDKGRRTDPDGESPSIACLPRNLVAALVARKYFLGVLKIIKGTAGHPDQRKT